MHLAQIRTFLEVAEVGSIIKAANHLHITQSAASSRIQQLEQSLNQILFSRKHSGVQLTTAGVNFQPYALRMLQTWQQAKQNSSLPAGFKGVLSLAIQSTLWSEYSRPWISWMKAKAPQYALRIEPDWSQRMMHNLSDGYIDIALTTVPQAIAGLRSEKLSDDTLILASSKEVSLAGCFNRDYIYIDWGPAFSAQHSLTFPEIEPPILSVGLSDQALQIILEDGGSAYLPERVVLPYLRNKKLYAVTEAMKITVPLYLVYSSTHADPEVLQLGLEGIRHINADN